MFDPVKGSKHIRETYRRFLLSTFGMEDPVYSRQFKEALDEPGTIAAGPYISMSDPFKKGKTLFELADEGIVAKTVTNIQKFHPSRQLYTHQEKAIREAKEGRNLVVTTGTGSGKTESFLIPIINHLLMEKERGTLSPGVRALLIYPMNALVNDQIDRLRKLLVDEPKITFGKFTGETPEKGEYEDSIPNEIDCRSEMRENPPHILISNYAMMEYMLLRPGDNVIFREENARNWKYIIFDEAHSYDGAQGIEVAALVRRIKAMLGRSNLQFILTSATLGDKNADESIKRFAGLLCGVSPEKFNVIHSELEAAQPDRNLEEVDESIYHALAETLNESQGEELETTNLHLAKKMEELGFPIETNADEAIYDMVLHDNFYHHMRQRLLQKSKTIKTVAEELSVSPERVTDFIQVASFGLKNGARLFEARYHFFLRGIEGVFITLSNDDKKKKLFIHRRTQYSENNEAQEVRPVYSVSYCANCHALYAIGKIDGNHFKQSEQQKDDASIFLLESDRYDEESDEKSKKWEKYRLCTQCGSISRASAVENDGNPTCGHNDIISVYKKVSFAGKKDRGKKDSELTICPCCHGRNNVRRMLRPYAVNRQTAAAVVATALYNELPSEVVHIEKKSRENRFSRRIHQIEKKTKLVKKFLTFSDSRQAAATFAPFLEATYEKRLQKRLMAQIVEENKGDLKNGILVDNFVELLCQKMEECGIIQKNQKNDRVLKESWVSVINEMANFKNQDSLMNLRKLVFEVDTDYPDDSEYDLDEREVNDLFKFLIQLTFMPHGAISLKRGGMSIIDRDDHERVGVTGTRRCIEKKDWKVPKKKLKFMAKLMNCSEDDAEKYSEEMWEAMSDKNDPDVLLEHESGGKYSIIRTKIKVRLVDKLYRCKKCRKVTPYNLKNLCYHCGGTLEEFDTEEYCKEYAAHYDYMCRELHSVPLVAKEHTAQLTSETSKRYQDGFKEGNINVLSCSTTFEMGVDVSSLETVMLCNMPPSPANYTQRAGRAGRSLHSAAYSVCFCRNTSHDLNYFRQPETMIAGVISPPAFDIENPKINLRHIMASAIAYFWRTVEGSYQGQIGNFFDAQGFEKFHEYLKRKPEDLRRYLKEVIPDGLKKEWNWDKDCFGWVKEAFSEKTDDSPGVYDIAVEKYKERLEALEQAKKKCLERMGELDREHKDSREQKELSGTYRNLNTTLETLKKQPTINFLSENNLIPRYSFPVYTVNLQVLSDVSKSEVNLNRDLSYAISEYAPDSDVVGNGMVYKSRYIRKPGGYNWPVRRYAICKSCNTLIRYSPERPIENCTVCEEKIENVGKYIIPQYGFYTDMDHQPEKFSTQRNLERTYRGSIHYISEGKNKIEKCFTIAGHEIKATSSKSTTLLILNEMPFFICPVCGYGKVLQDKRNLNYIDGKEAEHRGPYQRKKDKCPSTKLMKYALGHEFQTDAVILQFEDFQVNKQNGWTILYALLEGLSRILSIDRKELSGCLRRYHNNKQGCDSFGFVLFDNTPGGAGYVKKIIESEHGDELKKVMGEASRIVSDCNCGEETTCYGCLRNYYNQSHHEIMQRRDAVMFFEQFPNLMDHTSQPEQHSYRT